MSQVNNPLLKQAWHKLSVEGTAYVIVCAALGRSGYMYLT